MNCQVCNTPLPERILPGFVNGFRVYVCSRECLFERQRRANFMRVRLRMVTVKTLWDHLRDER